MRRLRDAVCLVIVVVSGAISRRPVRPLRDEARRRLPGDELLPGAGSRWTHGITIRGRPADIWPWLMQMGLTRAGWYSYDGLDNGAAPSADRIVPELQHVEIGDVFRFAPDSDEGFVVTLLEPQRALVLGVGSGSPNRGTWAFVLEPTTAASTRLITRVNGQYDRVAVGVMAGLVLRPIHFAMQRRQLLNLKQRVEAPSAGSTAAAR